MTHSFSGISLALSLAMSYYVTVAGKFVNEKRLDMISHNLANSLTAGFKASRPVFGMVNTATTGRAIRQL